MKKNISAAILICSLLASALHFPETILSEQTEYASNLQELLSAVTAADNGGTIIITGSFPVTATVTIPAGKSVTIRGDASSPVITRDSSFTGAFFNVNTGASLTLHNIVLDGASVTAARPIIYVNGGTCSLSAGTVLKNNINSSTLSGGGGGGSVSVLAGGTLNMYEGALITGNTSSNGSGVMLSGAGTSFTMEGGSIEMNNAGNNGGGVYASADTSFIMNGGSITSNTAGAAGGGVNINNAAFSMSGGTIDSNTASGAGGGGVSVSQPAVPAMTCTMSGGSITSNTAPNGMGGGISIGGGTCFILSGGDILSNNAKTNGGGIYLNSAAVLEMNGGNILFNNAAAGGGIYLNLTSEAVLTAGAVHSNSEQDFYQNTNAKLSSFGLSSQCPHCGRAYKGLFKDIDFAVQQTSPASGQLRLYAKYIFEADSLSNTAQAPENAEAEEIFLVDMTGDGPVPEIGLMTGDTQYVPVSVQLGSKAPLAVVSAGRASSTVLSEETAGDYSVLVTFQKQEWSGTAWTDMTNETETVTLQIKIIPKRTAPSLEGPKTISLTEGYSSEKFLYTVSGYPDPVLGTSGLSGASIDSDGTLHIPDGLAPGTYVLTITAENDVSPDAVYNVEIIVTASDTTETETKDPTDSNPKTRDSSYSVLWLLTAVSSVLVSAVIGAGRGRFKKAG